MIYFATFGGPSTTYHNAVSRICTEAAKTKMFDKILGYTDLFLKQDKSFLEKHGEFLEKNKRGYGYWLWKSYINYKLSNLELQENDIVVYADSGCILNINPKSLERLTEYIEMVNGNPYGILSFSLGYPEYKYTKMDCIEHFDFSEEKNTDQLVGGIFIYRICDHTRKLMSEWYMVASIYHLFDDSPSRAMNHPDFLEHRHDQSVFSIIRKKMGTLIIPDETYWYPDWLSKGADYPIWSYRKRNNIPNKKRNRMLFF